ncbi:hypothetical protein PTKIN_Ptkin09bG0025500 [Pterospermum kingtungense]
MGCGESKHVVTGNTISRKSSRAGSRRGKPLETIEETSKFESNTSSLVKEEGKTVYQDSGADNSRAVADGKGKPESKIGVVKENEKPIERVALEAGKAADALEDKKLSEKTKEETVGEKELAQETKIETKLVEETKGEATEDTVEDKKLFEERKQETGNGEAETVKEENLVKDTETAATTEAKVSTTVI